MHSITSWFGLASLILSAGIGIYFVSHKIFSCLAVTVMMLLTIVVDTVCVRSNLKIVITGYTLLLLVICGMCLAHSIIMTHPHSDNDGDEYISTAPTMTVAQIVKEYTRNPKEAARRYTNSPMNVTGTISRITKGRKHSHVELNGMFMCVCPQGSVRSLWKGLRVSITGTLRGQFLLDDCVMVKHPVK